MSKKNPQLKENDRIVLIYMPGESLETGTKGKVLKIERVPSFGGDKDGIQYRVEWYNDNEDVISTLSLLPDSDTWILDPEFKSKSLQERRFDDLEPLIKHHEWAKLFKKSDLKYIMEFLELIRQLGVVNMFQSGQFLGQTKDYITKYFDLHRMQRELDENDEELIEQIIERSEMVRNIMISAAVTDLERKNTEITGRSATNRVNRLASELVKEFMVFNR